MPSFGSSLRRPDLIVRSLARGALLSGSGGLCRPARREQRLICAVWKTPYSSVGQLVVPFRRELSNSTTARSMIGANFEQMGPEGRRVDKTPSDLYEGRKFFNNRVCPFGHRAWWSLLEKGLEADYIHIDLGTGKPQWYVDDVNSYGTVPCIYDNGKPVFESLNVAEYLEDKYPDQGTQLMPKDPWERALVREFTSKIEIGLFYTLLRCTDFQEQETLKTKLREELEKLNARYSKGSKSGPYFLGESLSLADIAIIPFLDRMDKILSHYRDFDILPEGDSKVARLRGALETANTRSAFRATTQTAEFFIQGYVGYAQKTNKELRAQL